MDWLDRRSTFGDAELDQFDFHPSSDVFIPTVHIQRTEAEETIVKQVVIKSEEEYTRWLREDVPCPPQGHPGIILVVHRRIPNGDANGPANPRSTSLRQSRDTFQEAAARLFQHRSIAYVVRRRSTAVFTSRQTSWGEETLGPSIVYNCKSDTEWAGGEDDMALSVTWFPKHRKSYGALYGCSRQALRDAKIFTDSICDSGTALHPLILPVIFIELERKRLFDNVDRQKSRLHKLRLEMEGRLVVKENSSESSSDEEKGGCEDAKEGWDATRLWMEASSLNSGLESFGVQLERMVEHSRWLSAKYFAAGEGGAHDYDEERDVGRGIEGRLREIMDECESKGRSLNTLLKGMSLATQMEWNYLSRQNAKQSHLIAERSKKDSGQMTTIARLGMIFLPGTFLASVFSMSFFKWIPEDSNQVVSPYIVIYAALAIGLTYLIYSKFWMWKIWRVWGKKGKRPAGEGEV